MSTRRFVEFPKTGFGPQDDEHGALERDMSRVLEALNATPPSRMKVATELSATIDAFLTHFEHEESLMRACRHPALQQHAEAHALFLADMQKHLFALQSSGLTPSIRSWLVGRFLEWPRLHVHTYDMGLALDLIATDRARLERARAEQAIRPPAEQSAVVSRHDQAAASAPRGSSSSMT